MTADEILERAATEAGLDDFGPGTFREGLERAVGALHRPPPGFEASELARPVYDRAVRVLVNRLRVFDYASSHPEVREERIERPLFVLGLPRTGTTVTSYLLDQDPGRRSLLLWEAFDTVPPATPATLRTDPRALALLERQREAVERDPAIAQQHWEWGDGPTQCSEVHGHDFRSTMWDREIPAPLYLGWLEDTDMTSAYEYERLVLQILQSQAPGVWSLKNPAHAVYVDWLAKVFPDARIVWTHRDPYRAAASVLTKKVADYSRVSGRSALDLMLGYYPRNLGKHVSRMMRFAEARPEQVYHLYYADFMRDPIAELRRLYAWAGDDFSDTVEERMRAWLDENPQHRFGRRPYAFDELGPDAKRILDREFGDYLAAYDVEPEG